MRKYINNIFLIVISSLLLLLTALAENTNISAPVKLGNKEILYIKTGTGSFSAQNRADAVSKKLEKIAKNPYYDINSITLTESENSTDIVANDTIIMTISDKDAQISKKPRQFLAREDLRIIRESIKEYREDYSAKSIILGGVYTVLATIGLVLFLILLNLVYKKLIQKLETYKKEKISAVYVQDLKLLSKEKIMFWIKSGLKLARILIILASLYFYLTLVLSFFPWTFFLAGKLTNSVILLVETIVQAFVSYLPSLIFIIIIVIIAHYFLKITDYIFEAIKAGIMKFSWFYAEWADITRKLIRFLAITLAATLIYPHLPGAETKIFQGFSIFAGILFSIGSTKLLSNMVAGIILTYTRSFNEGERVKIADKYGDIVEKDLLVTRIKTIKNEIVSIPNSKILDSEVINYSRLSQEEGLILHTEITIGYDVPREQVESLLIQAAKNTVDIVQNNEPFVFKKSLDDYYVTYELNAFTDNPQTIANTYSELHKNILDAFNHADVEIMSPHYLALRDGNQVAIPIKSS